MTSEIPWDKVEIGKEYKYEEKYNLQLKVRVKAKRVLNNNFHDNYYRFRLEILRKYGGFVVDDYKVGDVIIVGKSLNKDGSYLTNHMKFKPLDGVFDYIFIKE